MAKVYITNFNANYSYDVTAPYGDSVFMTEGYIPEKNYDAVMKTFEKYAKNATAEDFLFLSGPSIICALATIAWLRYHPSVQLLQHGKGKDEHKRIVYSSIRYNVSLKGEADAS